MNPFDVEQFGKNGYAVTPPILSDAELQQLIQSVEMHAQPEHRRGGVRDVAGLAPELQKLASHPSVRRFVEAVLGSEAFLVRATLFDKTKAANWKVPWHQDVTIAVDQRHESEGYGPWSVKAGVQHVQPPTEVLASMVTVRIHLDPCPASNGALRVLPGTHALGRMNQNHVDKFVDEDLAVTCEARAGECLVMRPLLLHTSSPSQTPAHRRVLHFDFASGNLAPGLAWRMRS